MPALQHIFCTIPNCWRPHQARGLCRMHYQRLVKKGDALLHLPPMYTEVPRTGHVVIVDGVECWAVPLKTGEETIVDLCDRPIVEPYLWHMGTHGYATRHEGDHKVYVHQTLPIDVPEGMEVDHKNRNKLDNRRCNLRPALHFQNCCNTVWALPHKTSRFRGVTWDKSKRKWAAQIKSRGATKHLGRFDSEEQAARIWDEAARSSRGEFALTNF